MRDDVALYPYQKIGSAFIKEHKYVLIGDEMGLGKTIQAISVMEDLNQVLVVCPAMLRMTWVNEVKKFTTMSVDRILGKTHDYTRLPQVLVVSYEGLKTVPKDLNPDMVVFDECHYLKNPKAARTKQAHEYVWDVQPNYCVGLSGTPIRNNVGEFYSILKMMSYNPISSNGIPIVEKSHYAFCLKFSQPVTRTITIGGKSKGRDTGRKKTIEITEFKGLRNKEVLKKYLQNKYIRRTSKGVLDLPPLITKTVNLAGLDSVTSKKLLEEWNRWIKEGKMGEHATQVKITSAMAKVPHTCAYLINMVEQGEQVVLFSDHLDPISAIVNTLKKSDIKCGKLTGEDNQRVRQESIDEFQAGKLQVICCSIKAASTGLTLTAARHLVFNDLSWVPGDLEQARKRIHRIGQDNTCFIHHMTMGTVDENIQEKIIEKSKLLREIL